MSSEDRFRTIMPLLVVFLVCIGIFSYTSENLWWFIIGISSISIIYLIHRVGRRE